VDSRTCKPRCKLRRDRIENLRGAKTVDLRRLEQLDRASKLAVNVSVLLGQGDEAPTVVELGRVQRRALEQSTRVLVQVQVLSWADGGRYVMLPVLHGAQGSATEALLADAVDRALDRFESASSS
jgi:hypothetical protein